MSKETLTGKITVVTGGARGIGYAIAECLLREGATVAFCATGKESIDAALASLSQLGPVMGVTADVSRLEDVRRFVGVVVAAYGGIDILVNNAAIRTYQPVIDLKPEDWDRMLAVNLSGAYYCIHEVLPILKSRGGGDIVNISSLSSTSPFAGGAGYTASKSGLNALAESTFLDYRHDGIRVSEVLPGSTDTDFNGPGGRADWKVSPNDVADAVLMLLQMPRRTTVSRIDLKPSVPPRR